MNPSGHDSAHEVTLGPEGEASVAPQVLGRGDAVGRYLVIERVGAGGMGVVYSAYDPELDRKVALKLLRRPPAPGDVSGSAPPVDDDVLLREAKAMARLAHPNVIRIHDVGQHDGHVFLTMEYVDGQTLAAWRVAQPRSWPVVLETLAAAGRGLVAAHRANLVHRDFKPHNVLVATDGQVYVLDFGLARPSEDLDEGGVGTPAYMAPELHDGRPTDARSDQYSFCVALYEALYSEHPFAGHNPAEQAANALQGEVRPRPAGSPVPQRLRRAVLRGLRRDPDERWPSMSVLLAELDLVAAAGNRTRRVVLASAGLTAVTAMAWATWPSGDEPCLHAEQALVGVWDDALRTRLGAAFARDDIPYAPDTGRRVAGRLDAYAGRWTATHRDACEATHVRAEQSLELLDRRMACLEGRRARLRALVRILVEPDEATVRRAIESTTALPDPAGCTMAEAVQTQVDPPPPAAERRVAEVRGELARAMALFEAGAYPKGLAVAEQAHDAAAGIDYAPLRAEAQYHRGLLRTRAAGEQALQGVAQLRAAYLEARTLGLDDLAADAANAASMTMAELDRAEVASLLAELARAEARHLGDPRRLAQAELALGMAEFAAGRYDTALEHDRSALARLEQLDDQQLLMAKVLHNMGTCLQKAGEVGEAATHYGRARDLQRQALGPDHPQVAATINNIGTLLARQGQITAAIANFDEARDVLVRALGPEHPSVGVNLMNVGSALQGVSRYDEAIAHYERALALWGDTRPADNPGIAIVVNNIGEAHRNLGNLDDARVYFERSLQYRTDAHGPDHPSLVYPLTGLALTRLQAGDHDGARIPAQRAIELGEASGLGDEVLAHPRLTLAKALMRGKRTQRDRAAALAAEARAGYLAVGDSAEVGNVDAFVRDAGL